MNQLTRTPNVLLAGFATRADLCARGLSRTQVETLVRKGQLIRLAAGVYVEADAAQRLMISPIGPVVLKAAGALVTTGPGAAVSHQTAAELHGLDLLTPSAAVTITRPPGAGSRSGKRGVAVHAAALPRSHVGGRMGIPVTTVPRTVIDLARKLTFREGVVVADSALHQKLTTKKELLAVVAQCPRSPGLQRAANVVEFAMGLAESVLESIARVAFRDCGLPGPELQAEIFDDEFIGRVDFLWRKYRTIVEVDGLGKYADPNRAVAQLRRDRRLREAGYEVLHFEWRDILEHPERVAAAIRAAFSRANQGRIPRAG